MAAAVAAMFEPVDRLGQIVTDRDRFDEQQFLTIQWPLSVDLTVVFPVSVAHLVPRSMSRLESPKIGLYAFLGSNRAHAGNQVRGTKPVGPFRFLAMSSSA